MIDNRAGRAFLYYAIAFGLAVMVRLAVPLIGEASLPVTMLTPTVAAAVMLFILAPEGGVRRTIEGLGLTHAGLKGWPLAIAGPALIHVVGLIVLVALGLTQLAPPAVAGPAVLAVADVVIGLGIGTLFALGEEIGWRGYMLPRLEQWGPVAAMLAVGFLHGVWHLPLMLTTNYYHSTGNPWIVTPMFLLTLTLAGIFFGFLRQWTASVWPVAIAHAAANTAWNLSATLSQTKSPLVLEYVGGESGAIMICGLLLIDAGLIATMQRSRAMRQA